MPGGADGVSIVGGFDRQALEQRARPHRLGPFRRILLDHQLLASESDDKTVRLWNPATGEIPLRCMFSNHRFSLPRRSEPIELGPIALVVDPVSGIN
jgi:hypothetical protein